LLQIDTEGAEKLILPAIEPWLNQHRPPLLLSMHAFAYPDDVKAQVRFLPL
jgi:hypothetical protein